MAANIETSRRNLTSTFFSQGIPRLWCPLLVHYNRSGEPDRQRMRKHMLSLKPHVTAYLVPGFAEHFWEMEPGEHDELVDIALSEAAHESLWVMIGILATEKGEAQDRMREYVRRIFDTEHPGPGDLAEKRLCGFMVTLPRGSDLGQVDIYNEATSILQTGYPLALHQLPQVTGNEILSMSVSELAFKHHNFYLFNDSSGEDRVALTDEDYYSVFLTRGAEGHYGRSLREAGGAYDGLFLHTANCFAPKLREVIELADGDRGEEMRELSSRLSSTLKAVFAAVRDLETASPLLDSVRALDHHYAFGPGAETRTAPVNARREFLPVEVIELAGRALRDHGLVPEEGYLERDAGRGEEDRGRDPDTERPPGAPDEYDLEEMMDRILHSVEGRTRQLNSRLSALEEEIAEQNEMLREQKKKVDELVEMGREDRRGLWDRIRRCFERFKRITD